MPTSHFRSAQPTRARRSPSAFDGCALVPTLACIYAVIISPLILYDSNISAVSIQSAEPGIPNRIFWPTLALISLIVAAQKLSRRPRLVVAPHMILFLIYIGFAGASIAWAYKPEIAFARYMQQTMVLLSLILPGLLLPRSVDLMRSLFFCLAIGALLNAFFLLINPPALVATLGGYPGYFLGKNYLGQFAAITLLVALHEVTYRGFRRATGIAIVAVSILLLAYSNSKTSFGLAVLIPILAGLTLVIRRTLRISPAVILLLIPFAYLVVSSISNFNMNRISYIIYGDSTFTGRTIIWDFANQQIDKRPLLGWGYQSFWLIGLDAPSVVEAPGFVKLMPNAHNGFYDTTLELGRIGYWLLLIFLVGTLHTIGRVADRDFARAWLALSMFLFVVCYNYLESLWLRGFEFLWVLFVIAVVEIARHWEPAKIRAVATRRTARARRPAAGVRGPQFTPRSRATDPVGDGSP